MIWIFTDQSGWKWNQNIPIFIQFVCMCCILITWGHNDIICLSLQLKFANHSLFFTPSKFQNIIIRRRLYGYHPYAIYWTGCTVNDLMFHTSIGMTDGRTVGQLSYRSVRDIFKLRNVSHHKSVVMHKIQNYLFAGKCTCNILLKICTKTRQSHYCALCKFSISVKDNLIFEISF